MIGFVYNHSNSELGFLSVMFDSMVTGCPWCSLPRNARQYYTNAAIGSVATNTKATERRFRLAYPQLVVPLSLVSLPYSSLLRQKKDQRPRNRQNSCTDGQNDRTKLADVKDKKKKTSSSKKVNSSKLDQLMDRVVSFKPIREILKQKATFSMLINFSYHLQRS